MRKKNVEVDIYIPEINVGIEYDGYIYHCSEVHLKKDEEKNLLLKDKIKLIRIREFHLSTINPHGAIVYQRKNNDKKALKEPILFIANTILNQFQLDNSTKQMLNSLKIDVLKDQFEILKLLNLQIVDNSFGSKHPNLVEIWDAKKNQSLTPFQVTDSCKLFVWWKCKNGHPWKDRPSNLVNRKYICPICNTESH